MSENAVAQLHAHVAAPIREQLAELARRNDRSIAAEIRRAVHEHLERERLDARVS